MGACARRVSVAAGFEQGASLRIECGHWPNRWQITQEPVKTCRHNNEVFGAVRTRMRQVTCSETSTHARARLVLEQVSMKSVGATKVQQGFRKGAAN